MLVRHLADANREPTDPRLRTAAVREAMAALAACSILVARLCRLVLAAFDADVLPKRPRLDNARACWDGGVCHGALLVFAGLGLHRVRGGRSLPVPIRELQRQ